jgi:CheY-like chemotaxis protein
MHKHFTCFLVDDDEDDREIFTIALKDLGSQISCTLAVDGMDALEKLRGAVALPDFIFLDLNMPRMDGKECIQEIKKDRRLWEIPVVIYSTSSNARDRADAERLGAAHFFTKPPSISALAKALGDIFSNKSLQLH